MNVRCPSCEALYRVDPAKVPQDGIRARCAECPALITITHSASDEAPAFATAGPEPAPERDYAVPPPPAGAERIVTGKAEEPLVESPPTEPAVDEFPPPPPLPVVEPELPERDVIPPVEIPELPESPDAEPAQTPLSEEQFPPLSEVPTDTVPSQAAPRSEFDPGITDQGQDVEIPPLPESPPRGGDDEQVPLEEHLPPIPDIPEEPTTPAPSADTESPAPEPEVRDRPPLEVMPGSEGALSKGPRRYTRPFVRPSEEEAPFEPAPPPSGPLRPTAPVFRPTPGMPIQPRSDTDTETQAEASTPPPTEAATPPSPPPPAVEPSSRPPTQEPPTEPAVPVEERRRPPVNPFLSKDPKQKARRLARALVSDMIVYQPQKRQEALAAGTLKEAFDEEIKKSWEEYVEQVGEEVAKSTGFFKEALNDILAGGNQVF